MWSRNILGEPVVSHLLKKFPHSMRQSFIAISTGPTTFPQINSLNTLQSCSVRYILMSSMLLLWGSSMWSFPSCFLTKTLHAFLFSPIHAQLILHDVITVITFGGEYESHMKDNTFKKCVILVLDMQLIYFSLFPLMNILEISVLQLGLCTLNWHLFC